MQKVYTALVLTLLCCFSHTLVAQEQWVQMENFPGTARDQAASISLGSFGYLGLGFDGTSDLNDFWKFDPANNTWTKLSSFPGTARRQASIFSSNGKVYVGLGRSGPWNAFVMHKDFWEYDPATDVWKQIADFGGGARYKAVAFMVDDKGYVTLGRNADGYPKDIWAYDPATNSWSAKNNFAGSGREGAFVFHLGGKVYVGYGFQYINGTLAQNTLYRYEAATDSWTYLDVISGVLLTDNVFYFSYNGKGYFGSNTQKVYSYDPASNTFAPAVHMAATSTGLSSAAAFSFTSMAFVATGYGSTYLNSVYQLGNFVKPAAPTNLYVKAADEKHLLLSWKDNASNETGYKVYRRTSSSQPYALIATLDANTSSYQDYDVVIGTTYCYQVRAFADLEAASGEYCTTMRDPFAPTSLKVNNSSSAHIELLWTDNATKETGFIIERNDGTGYKTVATIAANTTYFNDRTISADQYYHYRVKAAYDNAFSEYSNEMWANSFNKGKWEKVTELEVTPTSNYASFVINNKVYFGTGHQGSGTSIIYTKSFYVYDPATGNATPIAEFPGASRTQAAAFAHEGKGYVVGGYNGAYLKDLWQYDPATNSWAQLPDMPDNGRCNAFAFANGTNIYVGGGDNAQYRALKDLYAFNTTSKTWSRKKDIADYRFEGVAHTLNGLSYVGFGGNYYIGVNTFDWESYNPATDSWTANAVPKTKEAIKTWRGLVSASNGSRAFVGGGTMSNEKGIGTYTPTFWQYYPETNSWKPLADFIDSNNTPNSVSNASAFAFATSKGLYLALNNANTGKLVIHQLKENIPNAPAGLQLAMAENGIQLSWEDNSNNEGGFYVEEYDAASGTYIVIATLAANTSTYTRVLGDLSKLQAEYYRYRIVAFNDQGTSDASLSQFIQIPVQQVVFSSITPAATSFKAVWTYSSPYSNPRFYLDLALDAAFSNKIISTNTSLLYYSNFSLAENKQYYFRVKASVLNVEGAYRVVNFITLLNRPGAPTVSYDGKAVKLSWADNSSHEENYVVERSEDGTTYAEVVRLAANTTSWTDAQLGELKTYHYRVKAISSANASEYSPATKASFATTLQQPEAPALSNVEKTVQLSWADNSAHEENYVVERSQDGKTFSEVARLAANTTSWTDAQVAELSTYSYRLKAISTSAQSPLTDAAQITTNFILEPASLLSSKLTDTWIELSWKDNSGKETAYSVEQFDAGKQAFVEIGLTTANTSTFTANNLVAETSYRFRVRAVSDQLFSAYSNELAITTLITGIEEETYKLGFRLYPNPVTDILQLQSDVPAYQSLQVLDVTGKTVKSLQPNGAHQYDVSALKSGLYLLRIVQGETVYLQRFVKH